ncbi:MAG: peptide chain release factor N(5)-glutamine methyltransferase [Alphaproteobacteria bacterium]|jgi:release factor glutamine methyltransferase
MEREPGHEILRAAAARLAAAGLDEPAREARLLARAARDATEFEAFISRRATREPFAYIVGRREFWSLDFEVTPDVLIPRPDSETLVETALKAFGERPPRSIVDLGTGTGCLIVALLTEWPDARGLAVDVSEAALGVARRNATRLGTANRLDFACADFATLQAGPFDLVVSNPPYIPSAVIATLEPDVAAFEPGLALDGGTDGLAAYRAIARALPALLAPGGRAVLEIGWDQARAVTEVLLNQGFEVQRVVKDLAGNDRVLVAAAPI